MGFYQYVRELWKDPKEFLGDLYRERLIEWRKEPPIVEVERPTRIDRARALGYRAKQGFVMAKLSKKDKKLQRVNHTKFELSLLMMSFSF